MNCHLRKSECISFRDISIKMILERKTVAVLKLEILYRMGACKQLQTYKIPRPIT